MRCRSNCFANENNAFKKPVEHAAAVADVKIKREHVKGSDDPSGKIKPEIEPITEDTVRRMENPGSVEVCKSNSANKN